VQRLALPKRTNAQRTPPQQQRAVMETVSSSEATVCGQLRGM
jgi:hypothetical protein